VPARWLDVTDSRIAETTEGRIALLNGTTHPYTGAPSSFSTFQVLQALATEGKAPREQLRELRESLPTIGTNEARIIAYIATNAFKTLDEQTKFWVYTDLLDTYTAWKMKTDDAWWEELDRLVS
jgi:hypothetical protein